MTFEIYCDGSTRGNGYEGSIGAWAWLVHEGGNIIFKNCRAEKNTTNQRMELTAAAEALEKVMFDCACPNDKVVVYTDSAYLHNCYTQKWYKNWQKNGWKNSKKEPVANRDLWERLLSYFDNKQIEFVKVKGHAGCRNQNEYWNDVVDKMAQNASMAAKEVLS